VTLTHSLGPVALVLGLLLGGFLVGTFAMAQREPPQRAGAPFQVPRVIDSAHRVVCYASPVTGNLECERF